MTALLIGAGVGVAGTVMQGVAAKREAENAAAISKYNADVANQQARGEEMRAEAEARRHERMARELQGRQIAEYGKSGVMFRGSALTVLADTARQLELDRLMILREGEETADYRRSQATGFRMQAKSYAEQGRNVLRGSILAGTGQAFSGYGNIQYKQSLMD